MIVNTTRQQTIASVVETASNPWASMKGLLGRNSLPKGHALIITGCNSIHMMFMRFAIDVIFIDKHNTVVGLCQNIQPFAFSPIFLKSSCAIELPAGTIHATQTALQDKIQIG